MFTVKQNPSGFRRRFVYKWGIAKVEGGKKIKRMYKAVKPKMVRSNYLQWLPFMRPTEKRSLGKGHFRKALITALAPHPLL